MAIFHGYTYESIPAIFHALASPTRRSILYLISTTPMSATAMTAHVGVRQQAVSRHIAVLSRAGLVVRLGWESYAVDARGIELLHRFIDDHFRAPDRDAWRRGTAWW